MSARRWPAVLLWGLALLPARYPGLCQSAGDGAVALDLTATSAEDWRVPLEEADVAPELAGVTIQAYTVTTYGGERSYLGVTLPFSARTGAEVLTLLYAGPPLAQALLSELRIDLYGLNTEHSLAILLRDDHGGLHELGMGELDFTGAKTISCRVAPAFGPVAFAGLRVYAPPARLPRDKRLLLLLQKLTLQGGRK